MHRRGRGRGGSISRRCPLHERSGHRLDQETSTGAGCVGRRLASRTYRSITVPLTGLSLPAEVTQALALTESPTAGIPVPVVEAAVTLPLKSYSVLFFLQPPCPGLLVLVSPMVVVAELLLHVMVPPVARLAAAPLALL